MGARKNVSTYIYYAGKGSIMGRVVPLESSSRGGGATYHHSN